MTRATILPVLESMRITSPLDASPTQTVAATEACFPAFQRAIRSFQSNLTVDQAELLAMLEAVSAALASAAAELRDDVHRFVRSLRPDKPRAESDESERRVR